MRWPGLAKETSYICQQLQIDDCNEISIGRKDYRLIITKACHSINEQWLRKIADKKEKCNRIMMEEYGKKIFLKEKYSWCETDL